MNSSPQGLGGIVQPHQARIIGRDADGQRALVALDRAPLILRQKEDARQLLDVADAGAELPVPVIPVAARGAGIEAAVEIFGFGIDGEAQGGLLRLDLLEFCRFLEMGTGFKSGTDFPQRRL